VKLVRGDKDLSGWDQQVCKTGPGKPNGPLLYSYISSIPIREESLSLPQRKPSGVNQMSDDEWDPERFRITEAQMAEYARAHALRANERLAISPIIRDDMLLILDFVLSEVLPRIKIEEYPERAVARGFGRS
jgi:hypothetical protein